MSVQNLTEVGVVGEESSPTRISVKARYPLPVGTYVYLNYQVKDPRSKNVMRRDVVGLIGATQFKSLTPVMSKPPTSIPTVVVEAPELLELKRESVMDAILIADITEDRPSVPTYPPPPETKVYLATPQHLSKIYRQDPEESIRVGSLAGHEEDIEVRVNVNALVKHLLVTGVTGSGKSNFIAVLADRVAGLGGSVVIFDTHGEYKLESENPGKVEVVSYEASINLIKTPIRLLTMFIISEPGATKQRRILRNAIKSLNGRILEKASKEGIPLSKAVVELAKASGRAVGGDLSEIQAYEELLKGEVIKAVPKDDKLRDNIIDKIEDFFEWHKTSLDMPEVSELIAPGRIIDVDVSELTDSEQDWMLKVIAEDLLWSLKERRSIPTLLVVEEAHIFLSENRRTESKEALQRFVREGRKFGAMLAIVSQRPRTLDPAIVSQVQNFAFFKLVQTMDRNKVVEFSDVLSEEYSNLMPSFPPGHAILVGEWVGRFTVYAHIDKHEGKKLGASPKVVSVWKGKLIERDSEASKAKERSSLTEL